MATIPIQAANQNRNQNTSGNLALKLILAKQQQQQASNLANTSATAKQKLSDDKLASNERISRNDILKALINVVPVNRLKNVSDLVQQDTNSTVSVNDFDVNRFNESFGKSINSVNAGILSGAKAGQKLRLVRGSDGKLSVDFQGDATPLGIGIENIKAQGKIKTKPSEITTTLADGSKVKNFISPTNELAQNALRLAGQSDISASDIQSKDTIDVNSPTIQSAYLSNLPDENATNTEIKFKNNATPVFNVSKIPETREQLDNIVNNINNPRNNVSEFEPAQDIRFINNQTQNEPNVDKNLMAKQGINLSEPIPDIKDEVFYNAILSEVLPTANVMQQKVLSKTISDLQRQGMNPYYKSLIQTPEGIQIDIVVTQDGKEITERILMDESGRTK